MLADWLAIALIASTAPQPVACIPRAVAPGHYANPPAWGPKKTDSGAVTYGFIDLKNSSGLYSVQHGTDLSSYNTIDYDQIAHCGGTYAFIKIPQDVNDLSYVHHFQELNRRSIVTIPYFYLGISSRLKATPALFSKTDTNAYQALLNNGRAAGAAAAQAFESRYGALFNGAPPITTIAGFSGQLIALDVEERFTAPASAAQQRVFGAYYAAMLGAWVLEIKKKYPRFVPLLYTTPSVYGDELSYAEPADNKIIFGLPIWLAGPRPDAGDAAFDKQKAVYRLCFSTAAGNRCIVHQYTNRGAFAAIGRPFNAQPPHIDLDRFFKTRKIQSADGVAYVRFDN